MSAALRPSQADLLRQIGDQAVGFRSDLSGRTSWHLWLTDDDSVLVTDKVKRLIALGFVDKWHNPSNFGRGMAVLTLAGREALARTSATAASPRDRADS